MKVFISYSTKDIQIIDKFKQTLSSMGIEPYVALYDDQPGTIQWEKIKSNIKKSTCMLAVMTKDGSRSKWVQQEIAVANALNIPIIPVVEKGVNVKGVLEARDCIEFDKGDPSHAYERVNSYLSGLKKKVENKELIGFLLIAGLALFVLMSGSD